MGGTNRLPRSIVAAIGRSKILGVRAGDDHRFTGVWPVVIDGRVFARSWALKRTGWYHAFLEQPLGFLQVGERSVRVRGVQVRSEGLRDAVDRGYADKYTTEASKQYVRGFRTARRRQATIEFVRR